VIDAAPEQVWEAITDPAALSEWLAPEVELEPHEGGEIVCRYEDGEERRGEVELVEEAERLAFHWWRPGSGSSQVELIVDAIAERTRLTVIETSSAGPLLLASSWAAPLASLRLLPGRLVLA
jgi:uncharacterized protein YndB with AHSA1/START domain